MRLHHIKPSTNFVWCFCRAATWASTPLSQSLTGLRGYSDHAVTSTPDGALVTVRSRPLEGQEVGCQEVRELRSPSVRKHARDDQFSLPASSERVFPVATQCSLFPWVPHVPTSCQVFLDCCWTSSHYITLYPIIIIYNRVA